MTAHEHSSIICPLLLGTGLSPMYHPAMLDCNKISTALSLNLQFSKRANWTHLGKARITGHFTKTISDYNLNQKAEIKGVNG